MSQAEIENELRKHGSGFEGGKQRIMVLYQTQPDRNLRAKALAKEYGIGGHSHDFLDGSRGFVNHDWKGLEFDHYPDHQKITLKWAQVEKYIDLMIQSDRYLTDKEKEHYTPPVPITVEPDATLTHAKNLIRDFCLEEYDSEPDFSNLSKIGIAYTNATDEEIPIQVNVDLVGYRVERYLGDILVDERQYESLEDLTETELEALDFSELVSVTDEELEHYHSKAEERPALLPLNLVSVNSNKKRRLLRKDESVQQPLLVCILFRHSTRRLVFCFVRLVIDPGASGGSSTPHPPYRHRCAAVRHVLPAPLQRRA